MLSSRLAFSPIFWRFSAFLLLLFFLLARFKLDFGLTFSSKISRCWLPRAKRGAETYQRTPETPQKIDVFLFILMAVPGDYNFS
ncbi:MAG: hypothetical protein ACJ06V_09340 [Verrucomicrobiota bacterium]